MTDPAIWTFLGMSGLVIGLAYYSLRFLGNWQMRQAKGRRVRVLEAMHIGRDRQIMLVAVGKELLVLGSSPNGVNLVHRVPDEAAATMLAEPDGGFTPLQPSSDAQSPISGTALESSIRTSLGKMRDLLRKESDDHSDTWRLP